MSARPNPAGPYDTSHTGGPSTASTHPSTSSTSGPASSSVSLADPSSSSSFGTWHPSACPSRHDLSDAHYSRLGSGLPYNYFTPHILSSADAVEPRVAAFNASTPRNREDALRALVGEVGEGCMVIPPLYVEWGKHVRLGKGVYLGCGVTMQDTGGVMIGDHSMLGPGCVLATVSHPLAPSRRGAKCPEVSRPVIIGANVWLGARVTVLGGVSIGDGAVVGAGAVVTRSIPPGELWVGVPARKVRSVVDAEDGVDWDDVPPL